MFDIQRVVDSKNKQQKNQEKLYIWSINEIMPPNHLIDPFAEKKYNSIFNELYSQLCNYCFSLTNNYEVAEDIVQDQFINLWEKWERLQSLESIKGYLYQSVKNRSINYINKQSKINQFQNIDKITDSSFSSKLPLASDMVENEELQRIIEKAIGSLPNKCKTIFILKRIDEMSNIEIAKQLNISVKTVEAQMTIALKRMHKFVSENWEFFSVLVFIMHKTK